MTRPPISSYLVACAILPIAALVMLPGASVDLDDPVPVVGSHRAHGFPFVFLERDSHDLRIPAWGRGHAVGPLNKAALAGDILFWLAVALAAGAAEWRWRLARHLVRPSLRQLLLGLVLAAFGWWWVRSFRIEHEDELRAIAGLSGLEEFAVATAPLPLAERFGLDGFAMFERVDELSVATSLRPLKGEDLAGIQYFKHLRYLQIIGAMESQTLNRLPRSLRILDAEGMRIDNAHAEHLAELPRLTKLICMGTGVSDAGLAKLARMQSLKMLILRNCRAATPAGLAQLAALRNLVHLDVGGCSGVDQSVIDRWSELPNLKYLNLLETGVRDADLRSIPKYPKLVEIEMWATKITDASVDLLLASPRLERADVTQTGLSLDAVTRLRRGLAKRMADRARSSLRDGE